MGTRPMDEIAGEAPSKGDLRATNVVALFGMMVLTGCSINDVGMVQVTYTETDAFRTRHVVALGLHVETHGLMAGLSLGQFEALHIHVRHCGDLEPRLHYQVAAGLQVVASGHEIGLTLGKRETLWALAGGPNGASAIRFDPDRPENTSVTVRHAPHATCLNQTPRDI